MTPQRVTLITLGVADLAAARAFYARLGWQELRKARRQWPSSRSTAWYLGCSGGMT